MSLRDIAHSLFQEAIAYQRPSVIVNNSLDEFEEYFNNARRIFPISFGKASVEMMDGLLDYLEKNHKTKIYKKPLVVSNPQENNSSHDFTHIISSHPTPNASSVNASKNVISYVSESSEDDLVVFLISGGGSSLLSYPADGISLDDKIQLTKSLRLQDDKGNFIGDLRSACYSPHFKKVIGIAMINEPYCKPSTTGLLEIEGNSLAVKVCDLPFI